MAITGTFAMPEPAHALTLQGEYVMPYDAAGPSILTAALPDAPIGGAYSVQMQASGSGPFAWSATGLPAGLALSATGLLSGSASGPAGTSTPSITVLDANGVSQVVAFSLAVVSRPVITTPSIPAGTVGSTLNQTIAATGATPITWSIPFQTTSGASINSSGLLTIPSQPSGVDYQVTVKALNAHGETQVTYAVRFNEPVADPVARRTWIGPDGGGVSWRKAR